MHVLGYGICFFTPLECALEFKWEILAGVAIVAVFWFAIRRLIKGKKG